MKIIKVYFGYSGVFVRLKDKNLHVECFRCATCGTSLKNVGQYFSLKFNFKFKFLKSYF